MKIAVPLQSEYLMRSVGHGLTNNCPPLIGEFLDGADSGEPKIHQINISQYRRGDPGCYYHHHSFTSTLKLPLASDTCSPISSLLKSLACLCPQSFFGVWTGLKPEHSEGSRRDSDNCMCVCTFIHFTDAHVATRKRMATLPWWHLEFTLGHMLLSFSTLFIVRFRDFFFQSSVMIWIY